MKVKGGYIIRKVADSGVVISMAEMDCNSLMTLNETGICMWNLLCEDLSLDELVAKMMDIYDVEEEILRQDIVKFLSDIRKAGLLDE